MTQHQRLLNIAKLMDLADIAGPRVIKIAHRIAGAQLLRYKAGGGE